MNPTRRPLTRRDWALAGAGAAVGIGVGAAVTRWILLRRRDGRAAPPPTEEQKRQMELLTLLAEAAGNPDFDPSLHPLAEVILDVQMTFGVEPADGQWSPQTEAAVLGYLSGRGVAPPGPEPNPEHELEPEENWEVLYEQGLPQALRACCEDATIIAFDQAVIGVLERTFPGRGSFTLGPHTGPWKRAARDRARADLAQMLGSTEIEARAALCASVGRRALATGADYGEAVRTMAEHAWPAVSWTDSVRAPWQETFLQRASAALQPM